MNKIWIIEKTIDGDQEYFLAAESEIKALKQALAEIVQEFIHCDAIWDKEDPQSSLRAFEIYQKTKSNRVDDLRDALYLYNSFQYPKNHHNWSVFSTNVQEPDPIEELDESFFKLESEEDEEVSEEEIKEDLKVAEASSGATCRKCNNYNEYAISDTSDSTYLCGQCKAFTKVFGVIN